MPCASSPYTKICPTGAPYHGDDGIVAVDYDKCIRYRYCIASCCYGVRSFGHGHGHRTSATEKRNMRSVAKDARIGGEGEHPSEG
ncbi:MAG: hypothetical protein V3V49_13135 [Candidatus Krumholzibacteria bacterium]